MRKEILLAIIAGSLLGLLIAFGIWRANAFLSQSQANKTENRETIPEKTPQTLDLAIASPQDREVVVKPKVSLTGITKPGSRVVIVGEEKDYATAADDKGLFTQDVSLTSGVNNLKVFSFDPEDGSSQKDLTLIYSSEFAKFLESSTTAPSPSGSPEVNPIREKVKEKVETAAKKGIAYLGTVTDVAAGTIQIKNEKGEILQTSFDTTTEFVKVTESQAKKIEEKDVAIGDYLVVMGFANGNGVLSAKRVLVTAKPAENLMTAILGTVTEIEKKNVTLKTNDGTALPAIFGQKWAGPELKEIAQGDKIIVVGTKKDTGLEVRTLIEVTTATPAPSPSAKPSPSPTASPATKPSPSPAS